jgi:hypothetical protein
MARSKSHLEKSGHPEHGKRMRNAKHLSDARLHDPSLDNSVSPRICIGYSSSIASIEHNQQDPTPNPPPDLDSCVRLLYGLGDINTSSGNILTA